MKPTLRANALASVRYALGVASFVAMAGCTPAALLSGTSAHVAEGDAAQASGDGKKALAAYQKALTDDGLMDHEREAVYERIARTDEGTKSGDAVAVYRRLLADEKLSTRDRAIVAGRLVVVADDLAAQGRTTEAVDTYEALLTGGGARLPNRKEIAAHFANVMEAWARIELARVQVEADTESKLASLAKLRWRAHRAAVSPALDRELADAMNRAAVGAWPMAEHLEKEERYAEALRMADTLVAPLSRETPLRAKRNELAARVTQRFEALVAGAQGHAGALALRTGWMARATGRVHSARAEATTDLDRRARIKWAPELSSTTCADAANSMLREVTGGSGASVVAKLEVGKCIPGTETTQWTETYTYYVSESYTELQTTYDTVSEYQGQSCTTSYAGAGRSSSQTCTPRYGTRMVPRTQTVSRTRQVPRSGTRTITRTTYSYELAGSVRFAFDDKVLLQPFAGSSKEVTTTTEGPEGTKTEGATPEEAMQIALSRAAAGVAEGKARVDAERARLWLARAASAEAQKRDVDAEDAYATAIRIAGTATPEARAFLQRHLRMDDDPALALAATETAPVATARFVVSNDGTEERAAFDRSPASDEQEAPGLASGRERGQWTVGPTFAGVSKIERAGATEIDRRGIGPSVRFSTALASRLPNAFGVTLHDALHVGAAFGVQTNDRTATARDASASSLLVAIHAGYTFMAGYRTADFGLFAGVDPQARTIQIGDARAYGLLSPFSVRAEYRVNGPAIATLTAWGFSPVGDVDALGAELTLPLTRTGWMVTGSYDRAETPTTVATGSSTRETVERAYVDAVVVGFGRRM